MTPEQRIQALEDKVVWLEEALGLSRQFPAEWGLTPTQERMLGMLVAARVVTEARFMVALYSERLDPPLSKVVPAQLSKMRDKLRPMGVEIHSRNGSSWGYWIPAEQKAKLLNA